MGPTGLTVSASGSVDLVTGQLTSGWTLAFVPQGADQPVAVGLSFAGPLATPERSLNVGALVAHLNLRHLERQVQAVEEQNEALEAEANRYYSPDLAPQADPPAGPPEAGEADENDEAQPATGESDGAATGSVPIPPPAPLDGANDARLDAPDNTARLPQGTGSRGTVREELLRGRGIDPARASSSAAQELVTTP